MSNILSGVTHLAADGFLPIYRRIDKGSIADDVDRIRDQGISLALIAHGSDVRDPDAHMDRYDFSYYKSAPRQWVDYLRRCSRRNRRISEELDVPLFVSTPDLILDVPRAVWLPLRVELAQWRSEPTRLDSDRPTVLHVPSRRDIPIKGTAIIDAELRKLHDQSRINYLAPGPVRHAHMPRLVHSADIVVDQILGGYYGVAAVEGMAAGKLVVAFIGDEVASLIPERPPILSASPSQFVDVMHHILTNREALIERGLQGPPYAEKWHSGQASAAALANFLNCVEN